MCCNIWRALALPGGSRSQGKPSHAAIRPALQELIELMPVMF